MGAQPDREVSGGRRASAVIPLLWRAQEQAGGWVPEAAIRYVGEFLDMAYIRVLEVATFYTMLIFAGRALPRAALRHDAVVPARCRRLESDLP